MNRRVEFNVTRGAPGETILPTLDAPEESVSEQTIEGEVGPEDEPEAQPNVIELGDEP
jgi:hypothetical protein